MNPITEGVTFELIKRPDWQIRGFRIGMPCAATTPEFDIFYLRFSHMQALGRISIKAEGLKVRFEHEGFLKHEAGDNAFPPGVIICDITADEALGLTDLVTHRWMYAGSTHRLDRVTAPLKGFELHHVAPHWPF